eukprot:bmy_04576T0
MISLQLNNSTNTRPTNEYFNNISVMTRCYSRKHFPRPPHTNCPKGTSVRNNLIYRLRTFYHSSLTPTPELGGCWPPTGVHPQNPLEVLLLNTSVLLASGVSITWAHHSIMEGNRKHILQALFITITLGIYFTILQASEYYGLRWGLRIDFLHSHRIPQTTCNYWVYLPCCLFPAPIKIPLHIQPPLRL